MLAKLKSKTKPAPKFTLETFKKWLNKQNPTREFSFCSQNSCLLATALQDVLHNKTIICGFSNYYYGLPYKRKAPFSQWMSSLSVFMAALSLDAVSIKTVKNYLKQIKL